MIGLFSSSYRSSLIHACRFTEIPGKPHWWDGVLRTKAIENAIDDLLVTDAEPPEGFVLTVLWPWESGSLNGWEIAETDIPGRYASCSNITSYGISKDLVRKVWSPQGLGKCGAND